jgi:hypothetical protein
MMNRNIVTSLALLTVAVLAGCKVDVIVPEGGLVKTESESFYCAENEKCSFDIVDAYFDETFVAVPKIGYEFLGWKQNYKGLCGGETDPCFLQTLGFDNHELGTKILYSDFQVYLEPVFNKVKGKEPVIVDASGTVIGKYLAREGDIWVAEVSVPGEAQPFELYIDAMREFVGVDGFEPRPKVLFYSDSSCDLIPEDPNTYRWYRNKGVFLKDVTYDLALNPDSPKARVYQGAHSKFFYVPLKSGFDLRALDMRGRGTATSVYEPSYYGYCESYSAPSTFKTSAYPATEWEMDPVIFPIELVYQ